MRLGGFLSSGGSEKGAQQEGGIGGREGRGEGRDLALAALCTRQMTVGCLLGGVKGIGYPGRNCFTDFVSDSFTPASHHPGGTGMSDRCEAWGGGGLQEGGGGGGGGEGRGPVCACLLVPVWWSSTSSQEVETSLGYSFAPVSFSSLSSMRKSIPCSLPFPFGGTQGSSPVWDGNT